MKAVLMFYSKKLAAALGSIAAVVLVPVLNKKLGLELSVEEVGGAVGAIVLIGITYITLQFKLDSKLEGATTTAAILTKVASPAAPGPLPPEVETALKVLAGLVEEGSVFQAALKAPLEKPAEPPTT
jgi:hypothetical protein